MNTVGEKHSLYYIYTALSKPVDLPGIYEFSAMGLLDDTQIDYYNSKEKRKIPKQQWMKEKMQEDYWEKGTQSRKRKEAWFNVNIHTIMNRMRDDESDLHVLQWRHGCEVEQQGDEVKFLKGISEYGYDGENFLSFDIDESQWVAPVDAPQEIKRRWAINPFLNPYNKVYKEKECVDWLNKFREYGYKDLRKTSPPNVYVIEKKNTNDETKLNLTCLATGFYPKDVMMIIRKTKTSLPEHEIEFTGIRPNQDGSFQMRKSVEIRKEEKDKYDCFVYHSSLNDPIIKKLGNYSSCTEISHDGKYLDRSPETDTRLIGIAFFVFIFLAVHVLIILYPSGEDDKTSGSTEEISVTTTAQLQPLPGEPPQCVIM